MSATTQIFKQGAIEIWLDMASITVPRRYNLLTNNFEGVEVGYKYVLILKINETEIHRHTFFLGEKEIIAKRIPE